MLDFSDAQEKILHVAGKRSQWGTDRVALERVPLERALSRVLGEEVISPVDVPARDYSAMDGYAVASQDFADDSPVTMPVLGECQAGHPGVPVKLGACVRIFTGAPIPDGADAVVMQENTQSLGDQVTIEKRPSPGENVRRAGEDLKKGHVVLRRGTRVGPFQLGLLAVIERTEVLVSPRPRVTILCTGDELRAIGAAGTGLAESNSLSVSALARMAGADVTVGPIICDRKEALVQALEHARKRSDVIVTIGGVSVGDHDLVAPTLEELGAHIEFHKVRIKPGKPVLFAEWNDTLVLGLPGNPTSAQVTFALFGMPLLRALQGDSSPLAPVHRAVLAHPLIQNPGRLGFYRANWKGNEVALLANQSSGASTSMAWGNALVMVEGDVSELQRGDEVSVVDLNGL